MTIKGYGIKLVEFLREKDHSGAVDRHFIGRRMRIIPGNGEGELYLDVRPNEMVKLRDALNEELKHLVWTNADGWRNVDDPCLKKGA